MWRLIGVSQSNDTHFGPAATLSLALLRLLAPTARAIRFDGAESAW